jgi:16S rRNA C1402 (ribose-2'-O) methylase RsmI
LRKKNCKKVSISCGYKNDINHSFLHLNEHFLQMFCNFFRFHSQPWSDLEAGLPAVADSGHACCRAHRLGISNPLAGPSSMLWPYYIRTKRTGFAFNGYLPVKPDERAQELNFEKPQGENNHRFLLKLLPNNQPTEALLANLKPATRLCLAVCLTSEDNG